LVHGSGGGEVERAGKGVEHGGAESGGAGDGRVKKKMLKKMMHTLRY
jgi:hypothetical protein